MLEGVALKQLDQGSLNRGLSTNVDVRTPKERGGNYQWSARDTTLPYDEIKKRWDAPVAAEFEKWAATTKLDTGRTLLEQLTGKAIFREGTPYQGSGKPKQELIATAKELASFTALSIGKAPVSAAISPGRKAALLEWEEAQAREEIEHGILLDPQGKELGRSTGTRNSVPLPKGQPTYLGIFSHNHPARSSFSKEDLEMLFEHRLGEVRARTLQGTYSVSRRPPAGIAEIKARMFAIASDAEASIATLGLSPGERERLLNHTIWTTLAREDLINYHFIPMRPTLDTTAALSAKPTEEFVPWVVREGWAALFEKMEKNPEHYGEFNELEMKAKRRLPKSKGGTGREDVEENP